MILSFNNILEIDRFFYLIGKKIKEFFMGFKIIFEIYKNIVLKLLKDKLKE